MAADLWDFLRQKQVFLDQTDQPLLLNPDEIQRFYVPLAESLRGSQGKIRQIVAIAGRRAAANRLLLPPWLLSSMC